MKKKYRKIVIRFSTFSNQSSTSKIILPIRTQDTPLHYYAQYLFWHLGFYVKILGIYKKN